MRPRVAIARSLCYTYNRYSAYNIYYSKIARQNQGKTRKKYDLQSKKLGERYGKRRTDTTNRTAAGPDGGGEAGGGGENHTDPGGGGYTHGGADPPNGHGSVAISKIKNATYSGIDKSRAVWYTIYAMVGAASTAWDE